MNLKPIILDMVIETNTGRKATPGDQPAANNNIENAK